MRVASSFALAACAACASLPAGQYGVINVDWTGVNDMSEEAIEACLVTRERERVVFRLGLGAGSCGSPPFDSEPPKIALWSMPWSEWPTYDPAIFELDKERILRWYRARGYYDAQVIGVRTYVDGEMVADAVDCDPDKSSCELEVMVQVEEGEHVKVSDVRLEPNAPLPAELLEKLQEDLAVVQDRRFDEFDYEADKKELLERLWNGSYARAKVTGRVTVNREKRTADVVYVLEPGPSCVFGEVRVEGAKENTPIDLIIQAADIRAGKPFSHEAMLDAELAVFALGVFSSVQMKPQGTGSRVDLVAAVRVGRLERWSGGIGIMSGTLQRSFDQQESIPQWDVHLLGAWEHKSFLGGMRRLRIEERPRLIFLRDFPGVQGGPHFGNILSVRFEQPATFERRTTLFVDNTWDFGPDPYDGFFRSDLGTKVGLSRPFFRQRLNVRIAVAHDYYEITEGNMPDDVSSYRLPFLEQVVSVDLRNDPQRPKRGMYASVTVQEAFRLGGYGSWDYVRVIPDVRGYVPLMWDFVLAARFSIGALFIQDRVAGLDPDSARLGPQTYRLRGGGSTSNRGFAPGKMGSPDEDEPGAGIRKWEASLELRVPFGEDFGMVFFGDMGDVSRSKRIRFEQLNTAIGLGLRYFTILGAIRFDAGWRIPGWQTTPGEVPASYPPSESGWPDAFHLTIGEAF